MSEADQRSAEAYLESALEERLGDASPPDLSKQILAAAEQRKRHGPQSRPAQPRRWQQLLVAAVLLVAAGITLGVWWMKSGDPQDDEGRQAPIQDPQDLTKQDKKPTNPKVVKPKSISECKRLLQQVNRITVRMRTLGQQKLPVKISDGPAAPEMVLFIPGEPLKTTTQAMAACLKPGLRSVKWMRPHDLTLYLKDGRRLEATAGESHFYIRGLGVFEASKQLADNMKAVLFAAEIGTKTKLGILELEEIQSDDPKVTHYGCLPIEARHVRAHGFGAGDVAKLHRYAELESVDLRWSPDAHTLEDMRALVGIKKLRKLYLNGFKVTPAHLEILADKGQLEELVLLDRNEAYWRSGLRASARLVNDAAVDHIAKMSKLQVLVLPGTTITGFSMRMLARLEELHTLVLTGAPSITGDGFAHFRNNVNLRVLHLGYCLGLTDDGMAHVAKLPGLEELYLEGARRQTSSNRKRSNLTPVSLMAVATAPKLRRLALGRWSCRRMTHPIIYRNKDVWGFEPTPLMLRALSAVAQAPNMQMFSLADCTDLSLKDVKFVCTGASGLTMLDLSHVAGSGPGMIPAKGLGELMDLIPDCTVVYED